MSSLFFYYTLLNLLRNRNKTLLRREDFGETWTEISAEIAKKVDEFQESGSGNVLAAIKSFTIEMSKFKPAKTGTFIPTPPEIQKKKCIINVDNRKKGENKCLLYSVLAGKKYREATTEKQRRHLDRVSKYQEEDLKIDGIDFPTPLHQITKFEKMNNLAINIYSVGAFGKYVKPLRFTKVENCEPTNLLLISDGDGKEHFAYITSLERLLNEEGKGQHHFCPYCLLGFDQRYNGKKKRDEHQAICRKDPVKVSLPPPSKRIIKFNNYYAMQELPLVLYADFESILVKDGDKTKHIPSGFCIVPVFRYDLDQEEIGIDQVTYSGPDTMEKFFDAITQISRKFDSYVNENGKELNLTPAEENQFQRSTHCHICRRAITCHLNMKEFTSYKFKSKFQAAGEDEPFNPNDYIKLPNTHKPGLDDELFDLGPAVRDHCHLTGRFRGAAHSTCNYQLSTRKNIPVFFHNLRNYDGHHIMKHLPKWRELDPQGIEVIAKSLEKYTAVKCKIYASDYKIQFKDSLNFLNGSLDKLSKQIKNKAGDKTKHFQSTYKFFKELQGKHKSIREEDFELLLQKGIFPYCYMDDLSKLDEANLPPKDKFYDELSEAHITEDQYAHAMAVWKVFHCESMLDFQNLYMRLDVCLLADIYESFRSQSLAQYRLDPAHFLTSPSLSWSACLLKTGVELEILSDPTMSQFIDDAMVGGVSLARNPKLKANNRALEDYDPEKESSHLLLVDCNNQYGFAMSHYLPTCGFEWDEDVEKFNTDFIMKLENNQSEGYFFQVDLDYPEDLHDLHDQYPLIPEHLTPEESMLSEFQTKLIEHHGGKVGKTSKLCTTLLPKRGVILHYLQLKQALSLGLHLKQVTKVLKFKQRPWIKEYIDLNTSLRQKSTCKAEEELPKLFNNSFFGKTCEDVRKYQQVRIVHGSEGVKKLQKLMNSPFFERIKIYNENHAVVLSRKQQVCLDKPRYVGAAILSISKTVMYDFHYNFILKHFSNVQLGFTDTDSFCYLIPYEGDIYTRLAELDHDRRWMDFSNYPKDHANYHETNKLIPGKFKDEGASIPFSEGVFLRSKMYSLLSKSDKLNKTTAKGICRRVKDKVLNHKEYVHCIENVNSQKILTIPKFQHENNTIFTVNQRKKGLSAINDKIYMTRNCSNQWMTHSFGHYAI